MGSSIFGLQLHNVSFFSVALALFHPLHHYHVHQAHHAAIPHQAQEVALQVVLAV